MKLVLASISARRRRPKSEPAEALTLDYAARSSRLCATELAIFDTQASLLAAAAREAGRSAAMLILFDPRGELLTSEEFAQMLARLRDDGAQRVLFAIGPPDGWSQATLDRAHRVVSLGRMTLPHELARTVVAEQVYRALTILAGHPYHSGH